MSKNITTKEALFQDLLLNIKTNFIIPKFQRTYCWGKPQIRAIFDDILSNEKKFLGAIILQETREGVDTGSDHTCLDVIDGQQRISTLFWITMILSEKIAELCVVLEKHLKNNISEQNSLDQVKVIRRYAIAQMKDLFHEESKTGTLQTKLHCNLTDIKEFNNGIDKYARDRIENNIQIRVTDRYDGPEELRGNLAGSIQLIDDMLEEGINKVGLGLSDEDILTNIQLEEEEKTLALRSIIDDYDEKLRQTIGNLELVAITLTQDHDANEVFSKLNTMGESLNAQDIIRNELFSLFDKDPVGLTQFHKDDWLEFERALQNGIPDLDQMEDVSKDKKIRDHCHDFWYPYSLTISSTTKANDKSVLNTLRKSWKNIVDDPNLQPQQKAKSILAKISRFVSIYNCIKYGDMPDEFKRKKRLNENMQYEIEKIHRYVPTAGSYPYLWNLLMYVKENKDKNQKDITRCLKWVESYFIRKSLCGDDQSEKNVFANAWDPLLPQPNIKRLVEKLNDVARPWRDDLEIREQSTQRNFYKMKRAKFVLTEYERSFKGDPIINPEMEHVMPQTLGEDWRHITTEEHSELLNLWGNIVQVSKKINLKFSNKGFVDKQKLITDETSVYKTAQANLLFSKHTMWRKEQILERNSKVYDWAIKHWARPSTLPLRGVITPSSRNKEINKKIFDDNQMNVYLFVFEGNVGRSKRLGMDNDMVKFLKDNLNTDILSMPKGSAEQIDGFRFITESESDDPVREDVKFFMDSQASTKFWLSKQEDFVGNDSLMALHVGSDKKLYIINCSEPQIINDAIAYLT